MCVCVQQLNGVSQMKYLYKALRLVSCQQMKDSTISSASTMTAAVWSSKQASSAFGLAFHCSPHPPGLSRVLRSLSTGRTQARDESLGF